MYMLNDFTLYLITLTILKIVSINDINIFIIISVNVIKCRVKSFNKYITGLHVSGHTSYVGEKRF